MQRSNYKRFHNIGASHQKQSDNLGGKLEKQVGSILPGVIDISNNFFKKFQRQPIDFNIC